MGTTLGKMMKRLGPVRAAKIEARAAELIAEEMTLRDMRKAREMTQERIADLLEIGQDSVSRLEKRSDLLLSTLRDYVRAMGGNLHVVAEFPNRPPVVLTGLTEAKVKTAKPNEKRSRHSRKVARSHPVPPRRMSSR
jgi:transcriptional regulator with XRE-family HTH domain